jgi:Mn2+/Fe2+ NRAMP family transporter
VPKPGQKLTHARTFCALIFLSTVVGVGLDFVGIASVKALYWTAVINGLLVPFLLAILVIASDNKLMQAKSCSLDSVSRLGRESVDSTALPIPLGNRANSLRGFGND